VPTGHGRIIGTCSSSCWQSFSRVARILPTAPPHALPRIPRAAARPAMPDRRRATPNYHCLLRAFFLYRTITRAERRARLSIPYHAQHLPDPTCGSRRFCNHAFATTYFRPALPPPTLPPLHLPFPLAYFSPNPTGADMPLDTYPLLLKTIPYRDLRVPSTRPHMGTHPFPCHSASCARCYCLPQRTPRGQAWALLLYKPLLNILPAR